MSGRLWNSRVTDFSMNLDNVRSADASLTSHSMGSTPVSQKLVMF